MCWPSSLRALWCARATYKGSSHQCKADLLRVRLHEFQAYVVEAVHAEDVVERFKSLNRCRLIGERDRVLQISVTSLEREVKPYVLGELEGNVDLLAEKFECLANDGERVGGALNSLASLAELQPADEVEEQHGELRRDLRAVL